MTKQLQKGFTLIELLVVIAIIGILAAVVLVAINPAERIAEANDSKIRSDVGQVGTALENCFTSNQGVYAAGQCDTTANLASGKYLKQDLSTTVTVMADSVNTGEMYAYGTVKAASAKCDAGSGTPKLVVYSTYTGKTNVRCGAGTP